MEVQEEEEMEEMESEILEPKRVIL